jgi:putative ABC transport system permease protein
VSEVALALVLLIGAGLLIKSFSRLMDVNPGFRTDGVWTFQVSLTEGKSSPQKVNFVEQIVERLRALPGVQAVAATDSLPLTPFSRITAAEIEGRPPIDWSHVKPGEVRPVSRPAVTVDYFNAMAIPVRVGRAFTSQDARPTAGVVIVNEAFEKYHFPGESAVGKRIRLRAGRAEARWQTVVGVVSDVRQSGLAGDVTLEVYSPELEDMGGAMSFVIRVAGKPAGLISAVRGVMAEVDPNQPLYNVMTMEQRLANTTTSRRMNTALLGSLAGVALLLAVVGIYGVMSYSVTQRRREIGVRMALGAEKSDVLGLIIHGGLRLTLLGVALGLAGAFVLTRYLSSLLYSVKATDPWTFLTGAVALTGVALLASWLPARRAAKVHPMVALRCE